MVSFPKFDPRLLSNWTLADVISPIQVIAAIRGNFESDGKHGDLLNGDAINASISIFNNIRSKELTHDETF